MAGRILGKPPITGGTGPDAPPEAPIVLTATASTPTTIDLAWTDVSSDEDGFEVFMSLSAVLAEAVLLTTTAANVETFEVEDLSPGTRYYFWVRATKGTLRSNWSNMASDITGLGLVAPTLTATADLEVPEITLDWDDPDSAIEETGFELRRSLTGEFADAVLIAIKAANVVTHVDSGLQYETTYYYWVREIAGSVEGPWGEVATATTPALAVDPEIPDYIARRYRSDGTTPVAWSGGSYEITLTWNGTNAWSYQTTSGSLQAGWTIADRGGGAWYFRHTLSGAGIWSETWDPITTSPAGDYTNTTVSEGSTSSDIVRISEAP